ncbi:uncharacterized protein DSM5745_06328 [Aspergillus mulundensis]|uniref:Uncharacterized protein n=1 Tax=Aspergillus mulundensis TaxID=1810919 RepID=A0A3D8RQW7_9EURO|nr:hypothetical protein DSM5745_06328 [Aspergillus mulundensis]RDW76336.1 hypothetical protein DSM5745_06328 [Aspergillus mulundensis]
MDAVKEVSKFYSRMPLFTDIPAWKLTAALEGPMVTNTFTTFRRQERRLTQGTNTGGARARTDVADDEYLKAQPLSRRVPGVCNWSLRKAERDTVQTLVAQIRNLECDINAAGEGTGGVSARASRGPRFLPPTHQPASYSTTRPTKLLSPQSSYYAWVTTTLAGTTSFSPGGGGQSAPAPAPILHGARQKYVFASVPRHLSTLYRQYDDYGNILQDRE